MSAKPRSETSAAYQLAGATGTLANGCVNPIRLRGFYQRISTENGRGACIVRVSGAGERRTARRL